MIIHGSSLQSGLRVRTSVCIIGGGVAGLALARAFDDTTMDILLLEAGGLDFDAAAQEALQGSVAAASPHPPPEMFRRRVLGGASAVWGGRCIPLDPMDLEPLDWVPDSGWPIRWPDLEAYYPRAMAFCDAGDYA